MFLHKVKIQKISPTLTRIYKKLDRLKRTYNLLLYNVIDSQRYNITYHHKYMYKYKCMYRLHIISTIIPC